MSQVLDDLLSLLALEQIEIGLYRGQSQDLGFGHVFGGQVMGQALSAAVALCRKSARCIHCIPIFYGQAMKSCR